jgi:hypothetical protein
MDNAAIMSWRTVPLRRGIAGDEKNASQYRGYGEDTIRCVVHGSTLGGVDIAHFS